MSETKDWLKICADCKECYPPNDCEHYGEPRGCNAPTYGGPPPRYYAELRDENARLLAALKPVLEVTLSYESGELINWNDGEVCTDSEYAVSVNCKPIDDHTLAGCLAAVRYAQRIYKGVEECEVK